jgi:hypothetical protein
MGVGTWMNGLNFSRVSVNALALKGEKASWKTAIRRIGFGSMWKVEEGKVGVEIMGDFGC